MREKAWRKSEIARSACATMRVSRRFRIYRAQRSQQGCSLSLGMLRLAEPPTGRARLRSSLESPRNPITPIETSRVATLHPELYKNLREGAECRRARDARPYNVAGNCNCEMRLQRWVASWQRLDAFATVGCTAVPRRGAHCAPVYLRCYNNLSRGRAKGHRGDRKAPICNRQQGRRP